MGLFDFIKNVFSSPQPEVAPDVVDQNSPPPGNSEMIPSETKPAAEPVLDESNLRKFRITFYYIAEEGDGNKIIPVYGKDGKELAKVEPKFFAQMSLEGTGKFKDGKLLNVTGEWISVDSGQYQPVLDYHKHNLPNRSPGLSGIVVVDDKVTKALKFNQVQNVGKGYGVIRGVALEPFKTVAADIINFKDEMLDMNNNSGHVGVMKPCTKLFVKEFKGLTLPDGSIHDGWVTANDTGGSIKGCHFDTFCGVRSLAQQVKIPGFGYVTYDGIENRIPNGYDYGLKI